MTIVQRALASSPLVEVEIMHPISSGSLSFSRQLSLKRLAVDASTLDHLPLLPNLEELVVKNVQEDTVLSIERLGSRLTHLVLVGPYDVISDLDTSPLGHLTRVSFVVTSPPQEATEQQQQARRRFSKTLRSTMAPLAMIEITPDSTWTNASLNSAFCSYGPSSVTDVRMTCAAATTAAGFWFRLPSCISTWTALTQILIMGCQMPNFDILPTSLNRFYIQGGYGAWTQREAGNDPTGPNADFFDWNWLNRLPDMTTLTFENQAINATLPNEFSHAKLGYFAFVPAVTDTFSTRLSGTISPSFFAQYPAITYLLLPYQNLTGTFPNYGMEKLLQLRLTNNKLTHWPPLIINSTVGFRAPTLLNWLDIGGNNLVQVPSESDFQTMSALTFFSIQQNPLLASPFPNVFATTTQKTATSLLAYVWASGCRFYGELPEIPAYQVSLYASSGTLPQIDFNDNQFAGTFPPSWSSMKMFLLTLRNNPLTGTLATMASNGVITSQVVKDTYRFAATSPYLTGPMIDITTMSMLNNLQVNLPNVDFCAASRLGRSYASKTVSSNCYITSNATSCPSAYSSSCSLTTAPPASSIPPVTPPMEPVEEPPTFPPLTPPITPPITPVPESDCPMPSPGPEFNCSEGIWLSIESVVVETLIVPGHSKTLVLGNLTASIIIVTSSASNVNVTGCITGFDGSTPSISLKLSQSDFESIVNHGGSLTTQALAQSPYCSAIAASSVNIDTSAVKSCKKVKTEKIGSPSGFTAVFSLNSSGCNAWWIILVSVVCGVILVAVIVVVVLATVWRPFREKLRPFSRQRSGKGAIG